MKRFISVLAPTLVVAAFLVPTFASADVNNGSFETGIADPGSFTTLTAVDSTSITDWTVNSGDADYIGTYWLASNGSRSIDLDGDTQGSISQTFATVSGTTYNVTFDLSGNPDGDLGTKDVQVSATGGSPQDFTFDTSAMHNTDATMMWQPKTYTFTASGASTVLNFASQTPGFYGPALDNVVVTAVTPTCIQTGFFRDGINMTTAIINPGSAVTGAVDATGCNIGVYFGPGHMGSVTGANVHGANYYGVVAQQAAVDVTNSSVHDIGEVPLNGAQHGNAIYYATVDNGSASAQPACMSGATTGTVSGNTVTHYQKGGIVVSCAGSNVAVSNNTVTGEGDVTYIAQNGIQVSSGATGSVTCNTVSGNEYSGPSSGGDWYANVQSTGILLNDAAGPITVSGNTVSTNDIGILSQLTSGASALTNNILSDNRYFGILFEKGDAAVSGGSITGSAKGIFNPTEHTSGVATVHGVDLSGNTTAGVQNDIATIAYVIDATGNWWGNATGPTEPIAGDASTPDTNPGGTGSSAVGAVIYGGFCVNVGCTTPPTIPVYTGANSCSAGNSPVLLDGLTQTIDSQTAAPINVTLPAIGEYLFEATGDYGYGGDPANNTTNRADAGYATGDTWATRLDSILGIAPGATYRGVTSLLSDMGTGAMGIVNWGSYNSGHDYSFDYTTISTNVQFVVSDWWSTWYNGGVNNNQGGMGDNAGGLTLKVYQCTPTPPECNPNANQKIVSDTSTKVDGHDSVAVTPHPAWTASIPDATWIYSEALDGNGSSPTGTKTFTQTFNIVGTPANSSLDIAADNMYTVTVNGNLIDTGTSGTDLNNFASADSWVIPAADLLTGANTISITVTNPAEDPVTHVPFGNPNPGGLLYKLTINNNECVTPPTGGTISGMKYNDINRNGKQDAGEPGLQGWVIRLLLDDPTTGKDTLIATASTDAHGNYAFTNVAPGTYDVREVHQKGWKRTSKNPKDIVISEGAVVTDVTFGNATIKRGEKEDTDQDDNRDDQSGKYYGNHGRSDYGKEQNDKGHQQQDNNHGGNNNKNH